MAYKTIVTVVTNMATDKDALEAAIALARQHSAHLDILCLGLDRTEPGFYYAGAGAIVVQGNMDQAQADAQALEAALTERLRPEIIAYAIRSSAVQLVSLTPVLAHRLRLADLAVLGKPYGDDLPQEKETILEAALFSAAIPVLVIPEGGALPSAETTAVIAWNESRESLNAIRAAMPLLRQASSVSLTIIDPPQHGPNRSDPGGELSEVLARHGVRTEVAVLARTMPRISDILCRHLQDKDAQLLVMGAYGHSRFREAILGGTTRNLLEVAKVPVLMTH